MKALAARRNSRFAPVIILLLALVAVGVVYALAAPRTATAADVSQEDIDTGNQLFRSNCATCHGPVGEGTEAGPSLIGVGAASVDFQVGTGRMPMQMQGPQAEAHPKHFNEEQTAQLAAYVASLGAGPAIPTDEMVDPALGDKANGMNLFRTNCAMCHNVAGVGGALTEGKFAPPVIGVEPRHIYEAMDTGPQSMPKFNDATITPEEKRDIISYVKYLEETPSPGGLTLGSIGPVSEALVAWIIGIAGLIGCAVWLGARSS